MHALARSSEGRAQRGFTLVELVVTVAIVALLASIAMPLAEVAAQRNKERDLRHGLRLIRDAIDAYKLAGDEGRIARNLGESGYPRSLTLLVEGVEDVKSPKRMKIYFLRSIPREPFVRDVTIKPEETWGLRSYASSADSPVEGDDVYDVYSKNAGTGLNGVAYGKW